MKGFIESHNIIWQCDARIPLECDPEAVRVIENSFEAANMYLKREEVVSRIRAFLSAAKLANYEIPDEMQKVCTGNQFFPPFFLINCVIFF